MKRKDDLKGKKYDGFAIASFVIGLFSLLNLPLLFFLFVIAFNNVLPFLFDILKFLTSTTLLIFTSIISIILGIISLMRLRKIKVLEVNLLLLQA